ncbi:hypothetical protein CLF_105924 [Clonorchis sinensis]|uniref:Uncharacterized protein n=1 Tax=Clonorchis sinensis TaxID=79923 RepID=G7YEF0_CLOSI|nr:hypothetical protein CLF_105924 [Clonorchis sinensis]
MVCWLQTKTLCCWRSSSTTAVNGRIPAQRVTIPRELQLAVLDQFHKGHQGTSGILAFTPTTVFESGTAFSDALPSMNYGFDAEQTESASQCMGTPDSCATLLNFKEDMLCETKDENRLICSMHAMEVPGDSDSPEAGERKPLNDKNKPGPGNSGESRDPVNQYMNPCGQTMTRQREVQYHLCLHSQITSSLGSNPNYPPPSPQSTGALNCDGYDHRICSCFLNLGTPDRANTDELLNFVPLENEVAVFRRALLAHFDHTEQHMGSHGQTLGEQSVRIFKFSFSNSSNFGGKQYRSFRECGHVCILEKANLPIIIMGSRTPLFNTDPSLLCNFDVFEQAASK